MTDQELERRLARAVEHAAPEDLEGVLSRCQERKGTVISMKNKKNKLARRWAAEGATSISRPTPWPLWSLWM